VKILKQTFCGQIDPVLGNLMADFMYLCDINLWGKLRVIAKNTIIAYTIYGRI